MKRRILTIIGIVLVVFIGGLAAILINADATSIRLSAVSNTSSVSGNGGNAVSVGGYLYFIGNHQSRYDLTRRRQNMYGRVDYGAIWRIRLDNDGNPQYDNTWIEGWTPYLTNQDIQDLGIEEKINSRFVEGTKHLVVPKVAGHELSSLFIFGNHLIYTSPHNRYHRRGHLLNTYTDFFRVDLTGANNRRLFTSRSEQLTRDDFTVVWVGGQAHLLVNERLSAGQGATVNRLVNVNVNSGTARTISEDASSFAFPTVTSYFAPGPSVEHLKGFGGVMDFVYFTEERPSEEAELGIGGNRLKRYNLRTRETQILAEIPDMYYNSVAVSAGRFMWEQVDRSITAPAAPHNSQFRITESILLSDFAPGAINLSPRRTWAAEIDEVERGRIYMPTESMGTVFNFFTVFNSNIWRWRLNEQGTAFEHDANPVPGTSGVDQIIKVSATRIHFISGNTVRSIHFDGTQARDNVNLMGREGLENMNISVFTAIDTDGVRIAVAHDLVSYIRTITALSSTETGEMDGYGNPIVTTETMTIAMLVNRSNQELRLWNLEEEFVSE